MLGKVLWCFTKVSVMRTVYNYMLGNRVVQLCLGLSWAGGARLGILWQREMWRLGEEHLNPFFMVVEVFASKLTVVVLLGAGSHLKQPDYHC